MVKRSRRGSQLARALGRVLGRTGRQGDTLTPTQRPTPARGTAYPGDFVGTPEITYAPIPGNDNVADPGEIVWTWVPYEEDHSQGKDRPVLVIGRDGPWLLALPLTSKDHDHDADQEARAGRLWTDVGTGTWDSHGRASEVRVDRIVRVNPDRVRREGAALDEPRFNKVADAVRRAN
ncbi:MAG: type II toxin-antitoxin system PemK/MazF family toxin [Phycicoccus sp.]|nr:type II toxin-antitoxin system PemK/MazF family toxin [Phycicoccus sp.]NMM34983.1 type II toxin-antitoxin system PemK/MazF family toxin [Phycicoccus sp.]